MIVESLLKRTRIAGPKRNLGAPSLVRIKGRTDDGAMRKN